MDSRVKFSKKNNFCFAKKLMALLILLIIIIIKLLKYLVYINKFMELSLIYILMKHIYIQSKHIQSQIIMGMLLLE